MLLHPEGVKKRGKEEQKAIEQYDRGNEVPSTLKQQSSFGLTTHRLTRKMPLILVSLKYGEF